MDPKIMCGFTIRREELQYTTSGEPKNQELWKHILAGLVDRAVFWSTHTWLWEVLGISLLLPYKGDILEKRSVGERMFFYCMGRFHFCPIAY